MQAAIQDGEFDYIMGGAGSAGCVLAERLTRCRRHRVLLEAGGSDAWLSVRVLIGYAFNLGNPKLTWGYRTQPDPGLGGRTTAWPRGRVIGGCGAINAMAYVRGPPQDFEDWATGRGWASVQATYDRLETRQMRDASGRVGRLGKGPVWFSDLSDQMAPFSATFLAAARDIGLPVIADMNAANAEGVSFYRSTVRAGSTNSLHYRHRGMARQGRTRYWMRGCRCMACPACAWSMPRPFRTSPQGISMRRL